MTDASISDQAAAANRTAAPAVAAAGAKPAPPRSMDEIEAEIDATRTRLAGRIDELRDYVDPRNVLRRQMDKVTGVFVDEYGGIKPDRVLVAAGVVLAVVGLGLVVRRRRG